MQKITAIIVDDELFARENLQMLLNDFCPEVEVVGMGENIDDARRLINEKKPEAVFLDIRMPSDEEGLELLEDVENKQFQIVFVTAFKEYAIRAFNANAIHYILKPVDIDDLKLSVEKLLDYKNMFADNKENLDTYIASIKNLSKSIHYQNNSDKITISHSKGIKIVNDDSIAYLQGEGNCTKLVFTDGSTFLDSRTMKIYEDILNTDKFYRIHKKYIINLAELTDYLNTDGNFAVLKNGVQLSVARSKVRPFIDKIKSL